MMAFRDRQDAGIVLAEALNELGLSKAVVLGVARGGVVLAAEVARSLEAQLDVIVAKKIGHPLAPEYAIGAVTEGEAVWNKAELYDIGRPAMLERARQLQSDARRMQRRYLGGRAPRDLSGQTAIVVDDGIATTYTMQAAALEARLRGAAKVVVAAPVAPNGVRHYLEPLADEIVILLEPRKGFNAVSECYDYFPQTGDEEVRQLLAPRAYEPPAGALDLPSINAVLATLTKYPVSSGDVARKARQLRSPKSVVSFFESIPGGTVFRDRKDVMNRTLESEILMDSEADQPDETPNVHD